MVIRLAVNPAIKHLHMNNKTSAHGPSAQNRKMHTCRKRMPKLKMSLCLVGWTGGQSYSGVSSGAEYLTFLFMRVVNPSSWGITETPKSAILACPSCETNMFSCVSESVNAAYYQKKGYVLV